ncbi:MAG: pH regulation protein F [Acholeplasmataceae bacterium]|nr:MAG: pH regulation protein F [Acholeplasmataceae bacterium]
MSTLEFFLYATLLVLVFAIIASFIRLVKGPTLWDRILMLNLISAKVIVIITIFAILLEKQMLLDIAISYGIIGFLTMTLFSKFIMTGGREK